MHYYHQSETVLKSVEVEVVPNYPALRMMWQSKVDVKDVKSSFYKITSTLQETEYPLFIIVDLSNNPRLPIADTMIEALRGPFRNKKLIAWLVLSPNRDAR